MRPSRQRAIDQDSLAVGDPLADLVVDVGRLRRHRPDLRDRNEARRVGRPHPQQQIGERQIREELPFADKQVEPVKVGVGQRRVAPDQVDQIGHSETTGAPDAVSAGTLVGQPEAAGGVEEVQ